MEFEQNESNSFSKLHFYRLIRVHQWKKPHFCPHYCGCSPQLRGQMSEVDVWVNAFPSKH